MSAEKTALIIGSAPIAYVAACVEEIAAAYDRVIVVAKGEPGQGLERDTVTVRSFEGQLNVSNAALAKAILTSRPDAVYIVYGSWLGHNHIFIAVNFYMALLLKRYKAYLFSRSAQEVDLKKRISHPFTRVDLGLSLVHWLFLPLYLFVRLLGPLLRIRFEPMRPSALGHYEELEIYLGMRYAGHVPPRTIDVFCYKDKPCNRQILKMFRTKILIIPWARYLLTWNHYIPGGEKHRLDLRPWDYSTLITQHDCKIAFSPEDRSRAVEQMKTMGLQEGESFVCLGFRDGMFDQQVRLGLYGNQEDANARRQLNLHAFRNADIANAECAVDYLTQQGHKVVRMGSIARPLPQAMQVKAFDYANWDGRNELLDIYLGASCRFFLTTGYGLDTPPLIFRRPLVSMNTEYRLLRPNTLFTFRHHWSTKEQRPLSFHEIFSTGVAFFSTTTQFEENGIELRENTPEEIYDVVREMEERTRGIWVETAEDLEMQERFWEAARPHYLPQYTTKNYTDSIRIGTLFMKKNPYLLG